MWDKTIDKDKVKEQLVVDFSTAKVKTSQVVDTSDKDRKLEKIKLARQYGDKEIEDFEKYTKEYMEKVSHLAIFRELPHLIEEMFLNGFCYTVVGPVLRGEEIYTMPKEMYNDLRKGLYKELIKAHIDS